MSYDFEKQDGNKWLSEIKEMEKWIKPIQNYMSENLHPHVKLEIEYDRVQLVEVVAYKGGDDES